MEWNDKQIDCMGIIFIILYGYMMIKLYIVIL